MKRDELFIKLVSALSKFSENDLRQLEIILSKPDASKALVHVIKAALQFRYAERKSEYDFPNQISFADSQKRRLSNSISKSDSLNKRYEEAKDQKVKTEINGINLKRSKNKFILNEHIKTKLASMLKNKNLYLSTRDVVDAINSSFKLNINYLDYYKRGRRDLINNFLNQLSELPNKKRLELIKNFFSQVGLNNLESDEYQKLFSILVGNE